MENRIKGQIEDLKTTFTDRGNKQIVNLKNRLFDEKIEAIFTWIYIELRKQQK